MYIATAALVLTLSASAPAQAAEPARPAPTPWLKGQVEKAKNLSQRKFKAGTPEEVKWKADIKGVVDEILDWDLLSEKALPKRHWKKLSDAEKTEYMDLLRNLAEASYQSKLKLAATSNEREGAATKAKIEWREERVKKDKATATAMVKSKKTKVELGFKLIWKDGRWRVYDVIIDQASTIKTYRTSFGKIVDQNGFPELISRMKKRTAEIKSGKGELMPGGLSGKEKKKTG